MYSGSSTSTGQPALSPQPIHDALVQLDSLVKKLEQVIMDVIKDVDSKKKVSFTVNRYSRFCCRFKISFGLPVYLGIVFHHSHAFNSAICFGLGAF